MKKQNTTKLTKEIQHLKHWQWQNIVERRSKERERHFMFVDQKI